MFDICVVGAGASGMTAAIAAKSAAPHLRVAIIERNDRVGKKLALTGNGRCNISNENISVENYHGENPRFCEYALSTFDLNKTKEFFEKLGVIFKSESGGKLYPYSYQASSVVDAMRFAIERLGVKLITDCEITAVKKEDSGFLFSGKSQLQSKTIIIAAGGKSGGKIASDSGYRLLTSLGHTVTPLYPAIVQIRTDTSLARQLKGVKVNATVSVLKNGKSVENDYGEVLFCDYGLSGPPVLQLSRYLKRGDEVSLDLMPEYSPSELCEIINRRTENLIGCDCADFFAGMLQKRLGQVILKSVGININDSADFTSAQINSIANRIKDFRFEFECTNGFQNAQVTHGGAETRSFSDKTMMSKKCDGLYACGEVLDIDGDCGGFNLQWAWSSGYIAGVSAAKALEGRK